MSPLRWTQVLTCIGIALLLESTIARAQRFGPEPITLRIEAFVGTAPAGLVTQATWVVLVNDDKYTLQVAKLEVLSGTTAYFNIISALEPYPYAFTVYGDKEALSVFTHAQPGQRLSIIGNAQLGNLPGMLFISSIQVPPASTPAVAPTPSA